MHVHIVYIFSWIHMYLCT